MLEADAGYPQKACLKSRPFWVLQKESPRPWCRVLGACGSMHSAGVQEGGGPALSACTDTAGHPREVCSPPVLWEEAWAHVFRIAIVWLVQGHIWRKV